MIPSPFSARARSSGAVPAAASASSSRRRPSGEVPVHLPEAAQPGGEPERLVAVARVEEERERGADVGVLELEPLVDLVVARPRTAARTPRRAPGTSSACRRRSVVRLRVGGELLERVVADGVEHREARLAALAAVDEAVVDERRQPVEEARHAADHLRVLERPAADEDREPREQPLLVLGEQRVAPVDRRAQRLLARRRVARAAAEHVEAAEAREQRVRREELRPRRRELDREREPVEARADLGDGGRVGAVGLDAIAGVPRALDEQLRRERLVERRAPDTRARPRAAGRRGS